MENVPEKSQLIIGGSKAGNLAWGVAWIDTVMEPPDEKLDAERTQYIRETIDLT